MISLVVLYDSSVVASEFLILRVLLAAVRVLDVGPEDIYELWVL